MKEIETTRFGKVKIDSDHVVEFRDGMIGFNPIKKYVLVESPGMPLVMWLQSVDEPDVAFPLIEPWFFRSDYKCVITDADKHSVSFSDSDHLKILVVMTIPEDLEKMTVNLKAPVVINLNKGLATQTIIQDKTLEVRVPAYERFNAAVSSLSVESHDDSARGENLNQEDWTQVLYKQLIASEEEAPNLEVKFRDETL
jgi:flagellar assembly factor FliW